MNGCFIQFQIGPVSAAVEQVGIKELITLSECGIIVGGEFPERDSDMVWDYFASKIRTGEEYPMRVSVVARMSLFKDRDRMLLLAEDIESHDHPGYYYRMGAAWAASMIYVGFPDIGMSMLESGRMEAWIHNKTIQKICESRQVTDGDRSRVRALRRRRAP